MPNQPNSVLTPFQTQPTAVAMPLNSPLNGVSAPLAWLKPLIKPLTKALIGCQNLMTASTTPAMARATAAIGAIISKNEADPIRAAILAASSAARKPRNPAVNSCVTALLASIARRLSPSSLAMGASTFVMPIITNELTPITILATAPTAAKLSSANAAYPTTRAMLGNSCIHRAKVCPISARRFSSGYSTGISVRPMTVLMAVRMAIKRSHGFTILAAISWVRFSPSAPPSSVIFR